VAEDPTVLRPIVL